MNNSVELTAAQKDALLGRDIFDTSSDELDIWIWAGENDAGKDVLDSLESLGLAEFDGRVDGFLTYKLTESGETARKSLRA